MLRIKESFITYNKHSNKHKLMNNHYLRVSDICYIIEIFSQMNIITISLIQI